MYTILSIYKGPEPSEIKKSLPEYNYEFLCGSDISLKKILDKIKTNHFDAIISDYDLAHLSGIELLKKIRNSGSDIPFILRIDKGQEEIAIEALNAGADTYLRKDMKPEVQVAELDLILRKSAEKKSIQTALELCKTQNKGTLNHSPVAIIVIDKNTHTIVSVNRVALNMIGRTEDEVLGHDCHGLICPAKKGECPFTDLGLPFDQTDSVLLNEKGEHLDILKTIVPMQIEDNNYLIETIFRKKDDASGEKGRELSDRTLEGHVPAATVCAVCDYGLNDIIRFLPDATFVIDRDRQVIAWNKAMEEISGIGAHEVIGKSEYTVPFYGEDQLDLVDMVFDAKQDSNADYLSFEWKNGVINAELFSPKLAKGKGAYLSCIAFPLYDEAGQIIAVVESLRDISRHVEKNKKLKALTENLEGQVLKRTEELQALNNHLQTKINELKRTEEALKMSNKKLNLLNSITRHDIKNQLTVIYTYLGIANESLKEGDLKDELKTVTIAAEKINNLISFTSLYQDIGTKPPVWQNLNQCFENAVKGRVPESVSCSSDAEVIDLFADPLLEKVFYNLVDNTLRHGGDVTEIRLSHRSTNDELILIYEDNGKGIDSDKKEKIFERGYGENTGMGLFLIREILGTTGMTIEENGEPGNGARFEIHIPIGK